MAKKLTALLTAALLAAAPLTSLADDNITVYIDGEQLAFDVAPIIENERTLVPMRAIFEALGADISWDDSTKTVTASRGGDTIRITVDSNIMYKNDEAIEIDAPAKIVSDRTLVPVRAISESFNADVMWDGNARSVMIATSKPAQNRRTLNTEELLKLIEDEDFTDENTEELAQIAEYIRFYFEQVMLPANVFQNGSELYEEMLDTQELMYHISSVWDGIAAKFALEIQIDSKDIYSFEDNLTELNPLINHYMDTIIKTGVDSGSFLDGVLTGEFKNGSRICVLTMRFADMYSESKYIGIVASENGDVRYFTAENDMEYTTDWYVCEYTQNSRETLMIFEKTDNGNDIQTFLSIIDEVCNNK